MMSSFLKSFYKEPLVHFLLLSGFLFFLYDFNISEEEKQGANEIIVNNSEIMKYVQYRQRAFNSEAAKFRLEKLNEQEFQKLIDNYVREEALYREAITLGLDKEDYIIKQRMIQKVEYLLKGFIETDLEITEEELEEYFRSNTDRYQESGRISFFHIYFNNNEQSLNEVHERATEMLGQIKVKKLLPAQTFGRGDRFLYFKNYIDKNPAFISSHFGEDFSADIFGIDKLEIWQGPLSSEHGEHIVWIRAKHKQRSPALSEIRDKVREDLRTEKISIVLDKKIQGIVQKYKITQSFNVQGRQGVK